MNNYLIPIICFWFAHLTGIPQALSKVLELRVKPLDCSLCLSFWVTIIVYFLEWDFLNGFVMACFNSFLAVLLTQIWIKLKFPISI